MSLNEDAAGLEGKALEEHRRDLARTALDEGRFEDAFSYLHSSILSRAIRWFQDEGVSFTRPPGPVTPTELILGLATAAQMEVDERGEEASNKLATAAWALGAIAAIRLSLDEYVPLKIEPLHRKLAELIMHGTALGQMDGLMSIVELGWLDKLAQFEVDRERRRAGAATVNKLKASAKEQALAEAMRIAGKNPTLGNEALAVKAVEAAKLNTSIRTATEWVREWRRKGFLTPQTGT